MAIENALVLNCIKAFLFSFFLIVVSLLCFSNLGCNQTKQPYNVVVKNDSLKHTSIFDTAVLISGAEKNAEVLLKEKRYLAYIRLNDRLYDSVKLWSNDNTAIKYMYHNAALFEELRTDTALPYYFARAFARIGFNRYKEQYDDTTVNCLEKFLLLPKKDATLLGYLPFAYMFLGIMYNINGDINKALLFYKQNIAYATQKQDILWLSNTSINVSIIYNERKLYDSTIQLISNVIDKGGIVPKRNIDLYILQAEAFSGMKRFDEAISSVTKAAFILDSMLKQNSSDREMINKKYSLYQCRANLFVSNNDFINASVIIDSAVRNLKVITNGNEPARNIAKLYISKGKILEKLNQPLTALNCYQLALGKVSNVDSSEILSVPDRITLYPENTILEALDAKANAFHLLYQQKPDTKYLTTAIQCYTLSFEVEKKLMQYFSYDESKLLMLNESRHRSQKAIALCYQLYQLTKDKQWAQKAFEFAEKNKAFVLLESVKRNLASNSALQNDTLYQKVQSLQLQLAYTERSLAEASGDSAKQKIQQTKTKLENDLLFANTALGRQSIAYKTVMEKEDSISATMVSEGLLNENTGLVEFFNADSVTYAFVLNKKQPIQFIRYSANLAPAIDSLLYFFRSASAIGNQPLLYQKAAYNLYKFLQFDQLDKGWQNLIIIPDGKISFLPFDALITNTSYTVNLQQASYFINQCNTLYGYSAAILLKQLHNNQSVAGNTTVFAPVFSNSQNHQQPLQYSLQEAEAIAANKNTTSFIKEKATLANFKQQFTNSGILHIATHAYADTGLNSNPKIEFIDSSLLLNELYAMHTNASLVVLSACETGLGKLNSSEGPMSLARGFYYAGARNVITSYWNVDDKSTASLFGLVYKNIKSSGSAIALDMAKKELITGENGKFASPYYWAGFVHIGMPQKKENPHYWWWLLLPVAVVMGYGVLRRYTV